MTTEQLDFMITELTAALNDATDEAERRRIVAELARVYALKAQAR